MKKVLILILCLGMVTAMWGISPHKVVTSHSGLTTTRVSNDSKGSRVTEFVSGVSVYNPMSEPQETVTLTVIVDPDAEGNTLADVDVISEDGIMRYHSHYEAVSRFEVPKGNYIIAATFNEGMETVYVPDLELADSQEVHVCRDQVKLSVTAEWLLPDGSPAELPLVDNDGTVLNQPNLDTFVGQCGISYKGIIVAVSILTFDCLNVPMKEVFRMGTNVETSDIEFVWLMEGSYGDAVYTSTITRRGDEIRNNGVASNEPSGYYNPYVDFKPTRNPSPEFLFQSADIEVYSGNSELNYGIYVSFPEGWDFYTSDEECDFGRTHTLISLGEVQADGGVSGLGIKSPKIAKTDDEQRFYSVIGADFQRLNESYSPVNPINPWLSYPVGSQLKFGNSGACLEVGVLDGSWAEVPFKLPIPASSWGFGLEERTIDREFVAFKVQKYDETIGEGTFNDLIPWGMEWAKKGDDSELVFCFTNNNITVDGIEGYCVCKNNYDPKRNSWCMLQRVMFRDKSGSAMVKFNEPGDGTLILTGGRATMESVVFNNAYGEVDYRYINLGEADVKVEYAPTGSENYSEIMVTKVPSAFFPGFGEFWEAGLDQLSVTSPTGWFDLRVTITDTEGNYQEQPISPAFYVAKLGDIEVTVTERDTDVHYFNLQGMPVVNPTPGDIMIERSSNGVRKMIFGMR